MRGKVLKDKLTAEHIKQVKLAEMLGMSKQSLSNILNSDSHVGTELLERIAEALGVEMTFFYPSKTIMQTTNNISRQHAHNISNGSGDITETTDNDGIVKSLLKQNAELIELLKKKQ